MTSSITLSQDREMVLEAVSPTRLSSSGRSMREDMYAAYSAVVEGDTKPSTESLIAVAAVEPASIIEGVCIAAASRTTRPQVSY